MAEFSLAGKRVWVAGHRGMAGGATASLLAGFCAMVWFDALFPG